MLPSAHSLRPRRPTAWRAWTQDRCPLKLRAGIFALDSAHHVRLRQGLLRCELSVRTGHRQI